MVGQRAVTRNVRISGMVSCVPKKVVTNDHFRADFGEKVDEIAKMTGVRERRWASEADTTASLCELAANRLTQQLGWEKESIDAVIFVSQTSDYRLPASACALHGRLALRPGALAFDVNLGCSGYIYGLWLAFMIAESGSASRVLLAVGDTISKTVDPSDRATAMLFGDAGTVTAIERSSGSPASHFILGTDGLGEHKLIIPQGGFKTNVDAELYGDGKLDTLFMDGGEIFNFTLKSVPSLIKDAIEFAEKAVSDYDAFLLHQANAFMVRHLAKKARLPAEKVPLNIDRFGNTSSATIPLLMTTDLSSQLLGKSSLLCLAGFGVGYSWGAASISVGPLDCAELLEAA